MQPDTTHKLSEKEQQEQIEAINKIIQYTTMDFIQPLLLKMLIDQTNEIKRYIDEQLSPIKDRLTRTENGMKLALEDNSAILDDLSKRPKPFQL